MIAPDENAVVVSNIQFPSLTLNNSTLAHQLISIVPQAKLKIDVLDGVFASFMSAVGPPLNYQYALDNYYRPQSLGKQYEKVTFTYDNFQWLASITYLTWKEGHSGEVKTTTAIKLPNNGYFYNSMAEYQDQNGHRLLRSDHVEKLVNVAEFVSNFFGSQPISVMPFSRADEGRMEVKAWCESLKAWLYVTFEYGVPEGDYSKGYDDPALQRLIAAEKAKAA